MFDRAALGGERVHQRRTRSRGKSALAFLLALSWMVCAARPAVSAPVRPSVTIEECDDGNYVDSKVCQGVDCNGSCTFTVTVHFTAESDSTLTLTKGGASVDGKKVPVTWAPALPSPESVGSFTYTFTLSCPEREDSSTKVFSVKVWAQQSDKQRDDVVCKYKFTCYKCSAINKMMGTQGSGHTYVPPPIQDVLTHVVFTVTNRSDSPDIAQLQLQNPLGWLVSPLPPQILMPPKTTRRFKLAVTVPAGTPSGTANALQLTAMVPLVPSSASSDVATIHVGTLPVSFSPASSLGLLSPPAGVVTFDTDPVSGGSPFGPGRVVQLDSDNVLGGVPVRVFDFDAVHIGPGVIVHATGPGPLLLTSSTDVVIDGAVDVSGEPGRANMDGGGGGGGGGGAVGLFANGPVVVQPSATIVARGGDSGMFGLPGTGAGGRGFASGGGGGAGGHAVAGGAGGIGGMGGLVLGAGGGGGGGGAFVGPGGPGGLGAALIGNGAPGTAGGPGACPTPLANGGDGGPGGGAAGALGGPGGMAAGGSGLPGLAVVGVLGGGGGGGGGATSGGGGGAGGAGGFMSGGGGGGGAADVCLGAGSGGNPGPGGPGGGGGHRFWGGDEGTNPPDPGPRGGAGGGGAIVLASAMGNVVMNGSISAAGGDDDGVNGPAGGAGMFVAYGTLTGNGIVDGASYSFAGDSPESWLISGGAGGGGGGGQGRPVTTTAVDGAAPPARTALRQNTPNPFNPSTRIGFDLAVAQHVTLRVYNVAGHVVRTLVDAQLPADSHAVVWDGRDERGRQVASGVYLYRLDTRDRVDSKWMILLK